MGGLTPSGAGGEAAFAMLSKYLSRDFGKDNIRVNTILPAYSMQDLAPYEKRARQQGISLNEAFLSMVSMEPDLGRPGRPEEFGSVILFLASERPRRRRSDGLALTPLRPAR
jgi:NAD(P)-dependent dehydrogenase (short-subunit alcohol dehydrogenase family)